MRNLLLFVFFSVLASCGGKPECKNMNPVYDQYGPTDKPYKVELVRQLQNTNPDNVHFRINKYVEINNKPFVLLNIHADSFCAQMLVDLKNPNKMAHFKTVKGISFAGEEITGFQFGTDTTNGAYNFLFEEGKINGKKQ